MFCAWSIWRSRHWLATYPALTSAPCPLLDVEACRGRIRNAFSGGVGSANFEQLRDSSPPPHTHTHTHTHYFGRIGSRLCVCVCAGHACHVYHVCHVCTHVCVHCTCKGNARVCTCVYVCVYACRLLQSVWIHMAVHAPSPRRGHC